jgi:hypothetical protein
MRCYLLRKGHIAGVVLLNKGSDASLIEQGKAVFSKAAANSFDGFEIWHLNRKIYAGDSADGQFESSPNESRSATRR